ncbi:MAG: DUF4230 domain-containing protein [Firmicutes bacterium]|nr:DUF4230 domain-containing protein [Bacillota bacterium]
MENDTQFNEKELLEKVEKAAMEGAKKGSGSGVAGDLIKALILKVVIPALIILAVMMFVIPKISLTGSIKGIFEVDKPVEDHDLTIENHGFLGYTAADFAEAVLKDRTQLRKLSVMSYKVSDAATITVEGLAKLKMFSKNQIITYHGTAVYTIDLSTLTSDSILLDDYNKKVTIIIPHAQLEPINIQAEDIEYGDVEKGFLAFGSIKLEPEVMARIQSEAQAKMEQKLLYDNIAAEADRFAKVAVWELYQPIISSVSAEYQLVVTFQ